jgi:hypothetical protein
MLRGGGSGGRVAYRVREIMADLVRWGAGVL